mmetsp:Transcript_12102/g.40183  ORF Transcript_12102/g.40183 Transcript_12102/m.40183 type:complete len:533 (+) Transcript_12102:117-1715(+)
MFGAEPLKQRFVRDVLFQLELPSPDDFPQPGRGGVVQPERVLQVLLVRLVRAFVREHAVNVLQLLLDGPLQHGIGGHAVARHQVLSAPHHVADFFLPELRHGGNHGASLFVVCDFQQLGFRLRRVDAEVGGKRDAQGFDIRGAAAIREPRLRVFAEKRHPLVRRNHVFNLNPLLLHAPHVRDGQSAHRDLRLHLAHHLFTGDAFDDPLRVRFGKLQRLLDLFQLFTPFRGQTFPVPEKLLRLRPERLVRQPLVHGTDLHLIEAEDVPELRQPRELGLVALDRDLHAHRRRHRVALHAEHQVVLVNALGRHGVHLGTERDSFLVCLLLNLHVVGLRVFGLFFSHDLVLARLSRGLFLFVITRGVLSLRLRLSLRRNRRGFLRLSLLLLPRRLGGFFQKRREFLRGVLRGGFRDIRDHRRHHGLVEVDHLPYFLALFDLVPFRPRHTDVRHERSGDFGFQNLKRHLIRQTHLVLRRFAPVAELGGERLSADAERRAHLVFVNGAADFPGTLINHVLGDAQQPSNSGQRLDVLIR